MRPSWPCPGSCLCAGRVPRGAVLGSRSLTFPTVCFPASLLPSRQCPMVAAPRKPGLGSSQTLSSAFSVMVAAVACSSGLGEDDKPGLHRQQWLQAAPGHPIRGPTAPCMLRTGYGFLEGGTISFMMGDHPFQSPLKAPGQHQPETSASKKQLCLWGGSQTQSPIPPFREGQSRSGDGPEAYIVDFPGGFSQSDFCAQWKAHWRGVP